MSSSDNIQDLPKHYNPSETEDKWYSFWEENNYFHSEPDERESFTVVIPPPNVTGVLHMGHMLNNTIQDVLVRRARMQGYNTCWVPGTDHASIATEAKVVQKLRKEGIKKSDLSRDEYLKHAWNWTDKHGGIILQQLRKLGASCDWQRTRFTLEDELYESVIDCFIELYDRGNIYRGQRMVNWDPAAQTALSDEEVIHKEVQSKLYHVRYPIKNSDEFITIATTRPETILADTAVCVNPDDDRYTHLVGKKAIIPMVNREVEIIADEYVDKEYGTGCLKITPAHDQNDYEIGVKHGLEIVDMLNADGTVAEVAGHYVGKDRFEARKLIVKDLKEQKLLINVEEMANKVGYSERTDAVIEPRLSLQWFCKMDELSKPALDNVMNDNIQFHPAKFKNSYSHWMENIRDWCISRQLWWGQRIPAWYYGEGPEEYVIAKTEEEALEKARGKSGRDLAKADIRQDEDVLDTWFSSWLWPITVFDGFKDPDNEEFNYYYPTNDLVTGPDILFFWVARMIVAGYEFRGKRPFENVYFTGLVRDKQRRKMSKSLGNSPDALKLIEDYGADGVRVGLLLSSAAGNDLMFDEDLCQQGKNFANKIWNGFRLLKGWEVVDLPQPEASKLALEWYDSKFNETLLEIEDHFSKYRISDALMSIYKLVWDDYSSWLLELVKPAYQKPIDKITFDAVLRVFENNLKLLHPFMPFLTEEIWQHIAPRNATDALVVSQWPIGGSVNASLIKEFEFTQEVIAGVRTIRKDKNIPMKEELELSLLNEEKMTDRWDVVISKLTNVSQISYVDAPLEGALTFRVKSNEYFIPMSGAIDIEAEIKKITEELGYTRGFLKSVQKKLSNDRFVNNAPEQVVAVEKKKAADAEAKIETLEKSLASLQ